MLEFGVIYAPLIEAKRADDKAPPGGLKNLCVNHRKPCSSTGI